LWHNLRASCESDLATSFPLATVTKWLGNTKAIAMRHYVDPTDHMYELGAAQWLPPGLESENSGPGSQTGGSEGGAKSGALMAQNPAQQQEAASCKTRHDETQVMTSYAFITSLAPSCGLVQIP
jgi:hypothetical protein